MRNKARLVAMAAAALLGVATAALAARGDDNLKACAVKKTGELRAASQSGQCGRGEFAITISGDAFKKGRRGRTLTINGVAFKRSGRTLTINGTAFRTRGQTLTINGTTFRSSGSTLTINGTQFQAGAAAGPTGPAGPPGPAGPAGPAASLSGPAPVEVGAPPPAPIGGEPVTLASFEVRHDDGRAHRLLLTGGFDLQCNGDCLAQKPRGSYRVLIDGKTALSRVTPTVNDAGEASAVLSEMIVTPGACGPCTIALSLGATGGSSAPQGQLSSANVRLGYVDVGPVSPP